MRITSSLSRLTVGVTSLVDPVDQVELLVFAEDRLPVALGIGHLAEVDALATEPRRLQAIDERPRRPLIAHRGPTVSFVHSPCGLTERVAASDVLRSRTKVVSFFSNDQTTVLTLADVPVASPTACGHLTLGGGVLVVGLQAFRGRGRFEFSEDRRDLEEGSTHATGGVNIAVHHHETGTVVI